MIYAIRKPSTESMQEAVFDYLNRNRHRFGQHGNFDPMPSPQDHMPVLLARYSVKPPQIPASLAQALRRVTKRQVEIDKVYEQLQKRAKEQEKFDSDDCDFHARQMEYRCKRDFKDNPYVPDAYTGCMARVKALQSYCNQHHHFPEGLKEWGEGDLGIGKDTEDKKSRVIDLGLDAPNAVAHPSEQASWATIQMNKNPFQLLESSQPASQFNPNAIPLSPNLLKLFARPLRSPNFGGMGLGSVGGVGGGRKSFMPRSPGDVFSKPTIFY